MATILTDIPDAQPTAKGGSDGLVYRHRLPTRLWHWLNALAILIMLPSGLMIFNAHPRLYWGAFGANPDSAWLEIGSEGARGFLRLGPLELPTTGVLGVWRDRAGALQHHAFPGWATIPSHYDLAQARSWHLAFAWLLVPSLVGYVLYTFGSRHFRRDLKPERQELTGSAIWQDIKDHLRLRLPHGGAATRYNILQKLAYLAVLFLLLPGAVGTGLTLSPGMDAGWPWLLWLFGGRQSARSIHFLCASGLSLFIVVHLVMVIVAGPLNEIRSMVTGWFRLPRSAASEP